MGGGNYTVNPNNLRAGANKVQGGADAFGSSAGLPQPANPDDYGQIISGAVGLAEPFTTGSFKEFLGACGGLATSISQRLTASADDYAEVEANNAQESDRIIAEINDLFD